jgi:hypothetical protein
MKMCVICLVIAYTEACKIRRNKNMETKINNNHGSDNQVISTLIQGDEWNWSCQTGTPFMCTTAKIAFEILWDSINGKPRKNGQDISWEANPWVWVIEFKRIER